MHSPTYDKFFFVVTLDSSWLTLHYLKNKHQNQYDFQWILCFSFLWLGKNSFHCDIACHVNLNTDLRFYQVLCVNEFLLAKYE